MIVKMIYGYYGLSRKGIIKTVGPNDPPFEVSDEEAHRLIELGVAKAADSVLRSPSTMMSRERSS